MKVSNFAWGTVAISAGLFLSATGQVAAQQSASAQAMLEEVIVTARRREESLQDLPLSVAAISANAMQAQGIYNLAQVGEFIPNLTFSTTDRRHRKAIYIRGIGNDSPGDLAPVGTGVYIDGHYLPNTTGQMMSTLDIDRIEVLRGPQGTLFGKNTTGGAINVVSVKPGPEFAADILLRVADFGQQDVRATINVPFSDVVAARFGVAKETSDGYYYNRTLNTYTGGTDLDAFSAAMRFTPNDNWLIDLSLRANYQKDDDEGGQCRAAPNQAMYDNMVAEGYDVSAFSPVTGGVGQWGGSNANGSVGHLERLYRGATLDFWNDCRTDNAMGDFVNSQEKHTFMNLDNENFNATVQWDSAGELGRLDNLNVKLIASQNQTDIFYLQDRDMSSLPLDAVGTTLPRARRTTRNLELLFTGDVNERMQFVLGTNSYYDEALQGQRSPTGCLAIWEANLAEFLDPNSTLQIPCMADGGGHAERMPDRQLPGGPGFTGRDGYNENESVAIFGHLTYDLNEDWTLDLGARWTDEDRTFHTLEFAIDPSTCTHNQPGDPPPTALCEPDFVLSRDSGLINGFYNNVSANFSEVTPMVSLTRSLGGGDRLEDGMVYLQYAEGFLTGSFNDELSVIQEPALAPLQVFDPEHVKSYEVGFKGTFADGRVRLASAVFYMDYQDKQERVTIDNTDGRFGNNPFVTITQNASSVDIYGIELELRAQPWDGGFVSLDLGWLDNEYGDYSVFDPNSGLSVDRSGLTLTDYSPEWTVNASIEHAFQLGNGASLTPQLGLYYQSDYDFQTGVDRNAPASYCNQPAYTKLRARVTYLPANANWQASLFGSNITDERYFDICGRSLSGVFDYRHGRPDTWGMEFTYDWGN